MTTKFFFLALALTLTATTGCIPLPDGDLFGRGLELEIQPSANDIVMLNITCQYRSDIAGVRQDSCDFTDPIRFGEVFVTYVDVPHDARVEVSVTSVDFNRNTSNMFCRNNPGGTIQATMLGYPVEVRAENNDCIVDIDVDDNP